MKRSRQPGKARTARELSNQDIFAYALYRLGGTGQFVDVEDVVEECWRLSPSRFGWRTKKVPSDRKGWAALGDLEAAIPELMIKTENGLGRQLTAEGIEWIRRRSGEFDRLGLQETRAPKTRRPSYRVLAELERHDWARRFLAGESPEVSKVLAADILHCAPDSPRSTWRQRLATLRSAAVDNERQDIVELLDYLYRHNSQWFEGD